MSRFTLSLFLVALTLLSSCAHTYVEGTGMPADLAHRFLFHVSVEAQQRNYRTSKSEEGKLTIYAGPGNLLYYAGEDEILVTMTVPNVKGKTDRYYQEERRRLQMLNSDLINGARERARAASDFAY